MNIWLFLVALLFASGARKAYAYLRRSVAETVSADAFVSLAARTGFRYGRRFTFFPSATGLSFRCVAKSSCEQYGRVEAANP